MMSSELFRQAFKMKKTTSTIKEARSYVHDRKPNGEIVFVSPTGRVLAHYICDGANGYSFFTKRVFDGRTSVNGRPIHSEIINHWAA